MKGYEKRFSERIRAINDASNALATTAGRFGSSVKNAWGEMEKSTSEYGMRLAHTIRDTAQQLARPENSPTFSNTEKYHNESIQALNKIIVTVRKYVPKLHRGLKSEMASLNTSLARVEHAVKTLGETLDDSPGAKVEVLQRNALLLMQRHDELTKLKGEESELASLLEKAVDREKRLLSELEALTSQDAFVELKRYEEEVRTKEEEIKQFFQPLMKPLLKLERSASEKETSPIDSKTLHELVEKPVETLTTTQSFTIIRILDQLDEALSRGQLEIEERKQRRAHDAIQQAKNGTVDALHDEYMTLQANIQETLRQLRSSGILEKKNGLDQLLSQARLDKEELAGRLRDFQRRIEDANREIMKDKAALESQIMKLSHKGVRILVE